MTKDDLQTMKFNAEGMVFFDPDSRCHNELLKLLSHISEQEAELEALRSKPCHHIISGDEGTSYCGLAESSVKTLKAELAARD